MTAERMFVVSIIPGNDVVGASALKRLCKHVDGRVAIVEKDNGTTLLVRVVLAPDGDPDTITQTWDVASEIAELFTIPSEQPGAVVSLPQHQITKAEARDIKQKGLTFKAGGAIRFRRNPGTGVIQENNDNRRTVRFVPATIDLDVGDPSTTVDVQLLLPDLSGIDTSFNATRKILIAGRRMTFTFVNGVSTKTVNTVNALSVSINSNDQFLVEVPFQLDVAQIDF